MKKIIVGVDFHPVSMNALDYAAGLARYIGAELKLIHVFREFIPVTVGPEPWTVKHSHAYTEKQASLDKLILQLHFKYLIEISGELRKGGTSDNIVDYARDEHSDLIVVGLDKDDENSYGENMYSKISRKTSVPVLMVPPEAGFDQLKNITIAVDFDEIVSTEIFSLLHHLDLKASSNYRVVHISERGFENPDSEEDAKLKLGQALSGFTYTYDLKEYNEEDIGLLQYIESHPTDLLVMVAHKNHLLRDAFKAIHSRIIGKKLVVPLLVLKNK
jgi:nucleotide-binding universal stress UspA family protein